MALSIVQTYITDGYWIQWKLKLLGLISVYTDHTHHMLYIKFFFSHNNFAGQEPAVSLSQQHYKSETMQQYIFKAFPLFSAIQCTQYHCQSNSSGCVETQDNWGEKVGPGSSWPSRWNIHFEVCMAICHLVCVFYLSIGKLKLSRLKLSKLAA